MIDDRCADGQREHTLVSVGSRQNEGSDEKEKAKKNGHFLPPSLSRKPKLGP